MLAPHTTTTTTKSRAPPSPRGGGYENEFVDGPDAARDLQSDLFLLDQAMQHAPPPRPDTLLPQASLPAPTLEEEGPESLFSSAAFPPPLFDDASRLLCLENSADPASALTPFSSSIASSRPLPIPLSGIPAIPQKLDGGTGEPQDVESILQDFAYLPAQTERDLSFAKDHGFRTFAADNVTALRYPEYQYGTTGSSDVHMPGSTAFGRQKKRRLADMGLLYSDDIVRTKRIKSDPGHAAAYSSLDALAGGEPFNPALDVDLRRENGRTYSLLETTFDDSAAAVSRPQSELYDSLTPEQQRMVDHLREKIGKMPRRKLRECLAKGVSIEEVEPLMSINRDDLAEMLGLGVTTWKIFIHNTFGIPRWPARVLKSQEVKENSLRGRLQDAEIRQDSAAVSELYQEIRKLEDKRHKARNKIRAIANSCREKLMNALRKNGAK